MLRSSQTTRIQYPRHVSMFNVVTALIHVPNLPLPNSFCLLSTLARAQNSRQDYAPSIRARACPTLVPRRMRFVVHPLYTVASPYKHCGTCARCTRHGQEGYQHHSPILRLPHIPYCPGPFLGHSKAPPRHAMHVNTCCSSCVQPSPPSRESHRTRVFLRGRISPQDMPRGAPSPLPEPCSLIRRRSLGVIAIARQPPGSPRPTLV